ncbi:hypothetical protein F5887DRAFT_174557 [Amanita rubescens]|nr:hypothetical protein F5887DRAFT_174557 [Amanita rubescens]
MGPVSVEKASQRKFLFQQTLLFLMTLLPSSTAVLSPPVLAYAHSDIDASTYSAVEAWHHANSAFPFRHALLSHSCESQAKYGIVPPINRGAKRLYAHCARQRRGRVRFECWSTCSDALYPTDSS